MKRTIKELDAGQLELMWDFLKLRKNGCTKWDVEVLKEHLDKIRQALIQKTAGQRKDDGENIVDFSELGTYINFIVIDALVLYIYGGLDILEDALPNDLEKSK